MKLTDWLPGFGNKILPTTASIRVITQRDIWAVTEIDKRCNARPWSESDLRAFLREPESGGLVAEFNGLIAGYTLFSNRPPRRDISVVVEEHYRRRGVGTQLVNYYKDRLDPHFRPQLMALVSDRNLEAHLFFKAMGFKAIEIVQVDGCDTYAFRYQVEASR